MFERFTDAARDTVTGARSHASALGHRYIGTEHLLLALCTERAGLAATVLSEAGLGSDQVRTAIRRLVDRIPPPALDDDDAAALRTVGIDLDAVLTRIEESFGPLAPDKPGGAADPAAEPPGDSAPGPDQPRPAGRSGGIPRRLRPGGRTTWTGPHFSDRARKVIALALREAIHLRHNYIGTEHILLGLVREGDGLAARIITAAGVDLRDLRARTLSALDRAA